ncbi:MAG: CCDC34 family protein [Planctomycetaceae bacterium]|nr:CCDC34 family protein [Planctomycetaceae bacterium]
MASQGVASQGAASHRWHPIPIALVSAGALAVWCVAIANRASLGWWQVLLYIAGLVSLAAVFWFRRQLSQTEVALETVRRRLEQDELKIASDRAQVEELRRAVEQELAEQAAKVERREQALANRLLAYQEWMEFPQPVELHRSPGHPLGGSAPREGGVSRSETTTVDADLADLARKDRQLNDLLKAETKLLYEHILANKYLVDGKLQATIIRDDAYALIHKVVRIYRPDIDSPLLEASMARLVRGAGRAALQVLVVLDELPLNVKDASLAALYGYVRNAVKAWQMYKTSEPYWPYVNAAWYLGRFALGANPLTLGAWWFVGSLSQRGAKAVVTHLVNRQALALLSNLVRAIGYEVAGVYGGDFRHRDPNWIYAAELTELLAQFPLSRDSLSHALREVGTLELRSEYDRIFLYRSLANHKSARPQQYRPAELLKTDERHAIASRLEKFLAAFVHGKAADRVQKWKQAAEDRLGVKMAVAMGPTAATVHDQVTDGIRSLASFLIATKQLEAGDLREHLGASRLIAELAEAERAKLLASLAENPPFFFEHPDLDPDGDLVGVYLDDLAMLHARVTPRDAATETALADIAAYLRREPKSMQALLEKHYTGLFAQRLASDAQTRKFAGAVARAALDLLEPGEQARFLYGGATLDWPDGAQHKDFEGGLWLLGVGQRLVLFTPGEQPKVVWQGTPTVHAEQTRQLLLTGCRLTGGRWVVEGTSPLAMRLATPLVSSYATHFRPLLAMLQPSAAANLSAAQAM